MSTSETPTPLLPELPRPDESLGVVGLLLRLIEQRYGNDQAERETYRVIAGKTIERLADDIAAAADDPQALSDIVARLRDMAPQPTPPALLRCGMWVGLTAHKMWPAITERRLFVVVAQSADETSMPMPESYETHNPNWCGFVDLGSVECYPWDTKRSDAYRRAVLRARTWLTVNGYEHYLSPSGWDGRVDGTIAEHPEFARRVFTRDQGYTLCLTVGNRPIGGVPSRYERIIVPLDVADIPKPGRARR